MLTVCLGAASSAHAGRGMEIGLQDDAVFVYQQYYDRDLALDQARQLGVTRLRVNVLWNRAPAVQERQRMAPAQVIDNWAPYDSIVDAAPSSVFNTLSSWAPGAVSVGGVANAPR